MNDFYPFSLGREGEEQRRDQKQKRDLLCVTWEGGSSGGPDSDRRGINSLGPAAHVLSAACDEVLRNSTLLLAPPISRTLIPPCHLCPLSKTNRWASVLTVCLRG